MATLVSLHSVEQYAGRLNCNYVGKKNMIIYDYIFVFDNMLYAKRLKAYKQIGYESISGLQKSK